jgi:hypothetical protein
MPDPGPLGETRFDARTFATADALCLNNPAGGCVESVFTVAIHLFPLRALFCRSIKPPKEHGVQSTPGQNARSRDETQFLFSSLHLQRKDLESHLHFAWNFGTRLASLRQPDCDGLFPALHSPASSTLPGSKCAELSPMHRTADFFASCSSEFRHGLPLSCASVKCTRVQ